MRPDEARIVIADLQRQLESQPVPVKGIGERWDVSADAKHRAWCGSKDVEPLTYSRGRALLCCNASHAPNDHIRLLNRAMLAQAVHAAHGVMDERSTMPYRIGWDGYRFAAREVFGDFIYTLSFPTEAARDSVFNAPDFQEVVNKAFPVFDKFEG